MPSPRWCCVHAHPLESGYFGDFSFSVIDVMCFTLVPEKLTVQECDGVNSVGEIV